MTKKESQFCFCTLALGKKYRALAFLLAKDIEKYSPHTPLIVLTDRLQEFSHFPQVLAFKHQQQGVKCFHDKRFAITKALSLSNSCIFLDADMRIVASVPENMEWLKLPGITARACVNMPQKFAKVSLKNADKKLIKELQVVKKAAQNLNIDTEWEKIYFLHEYLFAVTKDAGKEVKFLQEWDRLANYFELNGVYAGEGNAIGLAAFKAGLQVRWSEMPGISFFNNKIELVRIQKGQSCMEEMSRYFEEHRKILHPPQSKLEKGLNKLVQVMIHFYRVMKLKFF
jgi:hypothetical protein